MDNSKNETEILSAEDERLSRMCRSLKRVDAPPDFDFKLKARIAGAKPSDLQPRFGFAFRYALPALALILVLGLLVYNGGFFSSNNDQIVAGSETPPNPTLPQNSAVAVLPAPEPQPTVNEAVLPANQESPKAAEKEIAVRKPKGSNLEKKRQLKNDNFNGSTLESLKPAPVLQLKDFEQREVPQSLEPNEKAAPISVKDVLSVIGINADFENGRWTVKSVTANSVGENSGVRANDIIEAIDDQPISAETVFNKTVKGKTVTVTRNGQKSRIEFRVKQ